LEDPTLARAGSPKGEALHQSIPQNDGINLQIFEQSPRGSFNPETSTITLLKAADLSTFLHESGHFFLETLGKMALDPNAPPEVKADMESTLKWMDVNATTPAEGGVQSGTLDQAQADDFKAIPAEKARLGQQVNMLLAEGKLPRGEALQIGRTSRVLRAVGAPNLPVTMPPGKFMKVLREPPAITPAVLKNLPDLLADPVMIFESSSEGLVVVTEVKDADGDPVLAALHLKARENYHDVNRVASLYGKDGGGRWLQEQIDKGRLLYAHKEKASHLSRTARLQLPGDVTNARHDRIILRKSKYVKPYAQGGKDCPD